MPGEVLEFLPAPTGFKITAKHHPNKVAPLGHGPLHLCHASRKHETMRDAGIAAESLPFTGISWRRDGRGRGGWCFAETQSECKSRTAPLDMVGGIVETHSLCSVSVIFLWLSPLRGSACIYVNLHVNFHGETISHFTLLIKKKPTVSR